MLSGRISILYQKFCSGVFRSRRNSTNDESWSYESDEDEFGTPLEVKGNINRAAARFTNNIAIVTYPENC